MRLTHSTECNRLFTMFNAAMSRHDAVPQELPDECHDASYDEVLRIRDLGDDASSRCPKCLASVDEARRRRSR